ncbi:MAG: hypothetical protein D6806_04890 [Deltaproteobacteria bacterium]|nr:MAG: hypothetical protein D6806_04890 [Deltaproteobacteria bacterium]
MIFIFYLAMPISALADFSTELVECTDAQTLLLSCTGEGKNLDAALNAARRECLRWYLEQMLVDPAGASSLAERIELDRVVEMPRGAPTRGVGIKSKFRTEKGVRVSILTRLFRARLDSMLERLDALPEKLKAALQNTIVDIEVGKMEGGEKYRTTLDELARSFISSLGWSVLPRSFSKLKGKTVAKPNVLVELSAVRRTRKLDWGSGGKRLAVTYTVTAKAIDTVKNILIASSVRTGTERPLFSADAEWQAIRDSAMDAVCRMELALRRKIARAQ